ncbi:MAG: Tat pathway signal sequence domain protein, partial [Tistlia sp.]
QGEACRAYLLFENERGGEYPVYRLDLVLFDTQGRIDRRIAVDASPLRAGKSVVKLFDLSGLQCDAISKILLNDISPCEDGSGERDDCVVQARLNSLTDVDFYK